MPVKISGITVTMVPVYGEGLYIVPVKFLSLDFFFFASLRLWSKKSARPKAHLTKVSMLRSFFFFNKSLEVLTFVVDTGFLKRKCEQLFLSYMWLLYWEPCFHKWTPLKHLVHFWTRFILIWWKLPLRGFPNFISSWLFLKYLDFRIQNKGLIEPEAARPMWG